MKFELIYTSEEAAEAYGANGPQYSTPGACAFDLRAFPEPGIDQIVISTNYQMLIGTGIQIQPAPGEIDKFNSVEDQDIRVGSIILPRSGRGSKEGLCIGNTVGLIDQDYQGELMVMAYARPTIGSSTPPVIIKRGERFAQLVITPFIVATFDVRTAFSDPSERAAGGFGSTGHH